MNNRAIGRSSDQAKRASNQKIYRSSVWVIERLSKHPYYRTTEQSNDKQIVRASRRPWDIRFPSIQLLVQIQDFASCHVMCFMFNYFVWKQSSGSHPFLICSCSMGHVRLLLCICFSSAPCQRLMSRTHSA